VRLPAGPAVVSTDVGEPPSMDTLAIPQLSHLTPIQLTAVPVKLNVAVDPVTLEATMVPPLKVPVPEPNAVHEPVVVAALSSERVTARGGASGWRGVPPPPMLVGLLLSTTSSAPSGPFSAPKMKAGAPPLSSM